MQRTWLGCNPSFNVIGDFFENNLLFLRADNRLQR